MTDSIGFYEIERGTAGDDTIAGQNLTVHFGFEGDDRFINTTPLVDTVFVGGAGADRYVASNIGFTTIIEAGGSDGDVYADALGVDLQSFSLEIDGRHLLIAPESDNAGLLFVDWERPENRIENFELIVPTAAGPETRSVPYEDFRGAVLSSPFYLGDFTAEQLAGITDIGVLETVIAGIYGAAELRAALTQEEVQLVAYLYEAALDRDGAIDLEGLNYWIDQREGGLSEEALAKAFFESAEFRAAFGDPAALGDRALVELLYRNVLDREGEPEGIAFWISVAEQPEVSDAELLIAFAESPENRAGSPFVETLAEVGDGFWAFA